MHTDLREACQAFFPELPADSVDKLLTIKALLLEWNEKINLISRKDVEAIVPNHFLPSLGFLKAHAFAPGTQAMDVGTGGGFPGLVLAAVLPEVEWVLVDSIGKKIKAIEAMVQALGLKQTRVVHGRVEAVWGQFDAITGRAVTALPDFLHWVTPKLKSQGQVVYFKGGELEPELAPLKPKKQVWMRDALPGLEDTGKYWVTFQAQDLFRWREAKGL